MFTFEIDGCKFEISVSDHAVIRMKQRRVNRYASYGSIVSLGDKLLDMTNKEEFCIIDKELDIAVVCALSYELNREGLPVIEINIITVLDSSRFYVKAGTKVYELAV